MKIAVFDLQPHEKRMFNKLEPQYRIHYFKESADDVNLQAVKDCDVISVFVLSKLSAEVLKQFPKLKMVAARSTGFDNIDLKYCAKHKIIVCNVPAYGEVTVAEHTFALLLAVSRKLQVAVLQWQKKKFDPQPLKGFDLHGKTIGVIGAGKIGKNVIRIAHGFGMEILAYDINRDRLLSEILDFKYTDLKTLLKKSDIISLHAPYDKSTHHLINKKNIKFFKHGAVLLNTARGGLVETAALFKALQDDTLSAAGLDVLEEENVILKNQKTTSKNKDVALINKKIINLPQVVFTPHIAFNTEEAVERITQTSIENIISFHNGHVINKV